ncbi:MAG: 50S ribosomal protein L10 [Sandaracinaceae bacterium]
MATREEKAAVVESVKGSFEKAVAVVLVDYSGIDVPAITDLRSRFRAAGVEYKVVKNRLIKQALKGASFEEDETWNGALKGMTAVAWSFEDPSAAAKIIKAFRKEDPAHEELEVKGGLLDEEVLSAERVNNELATLPGKDEVRAMLLAQLNAPAQALVRQLNAPGQNFVYALDAYQRKQEGA